MVPDSDSASSVSEHIKDFSLEDFTLFYINMAAI